MTIGDAHCHFFSPDFFRALGREAAVDGDGATSVPAALGWDRPDTAEALADRWVAELDRHAVSRAMLIASVPGDEKSVAVAVARHPSRFRGAFMFNPLTAAAPMQLDRAFEELGLKTVCLFPAMHHVAVDSPAVEAVFVAAERHVGAVFVHCGVLSFGVRKKLGLPSHFDLRLGDPLAVAAMAVKYPTVPVVIPHFGAGLFREALMAVSASPNIRLDTSSSNEWTRFHPGLTLRDVFARAIDVAGPARLLFGTDSSFYPRGWQKGIYDTQREILDGLGVGDADQSRIFGGNLEAL